MSARAAVVIDEFGSVQGLLTMDDLFAALVDDIQTSADVQQQIVRREDGSYLVDALLPVGEFIRYFEIAHVDEAETVGFYTLGGLLLAKAFPQTGETFRWHGFTLEVMDMDGNRIDKVMVKRVK